MEKTFFTKNTSHLDFPGGTVNESLPDAGTWVQFLVWEDPTCSGAAEPTGHQILRTRCPRV